MTDNNTEKIQRSKELLKKYGPEALKMTGKVLFAGTAAVCSTFVLLAPSQNYTESSELGQKLTQYFGEKAWMVLYVSGAMEIGGHNFFFAPEAIQQFIDYVARQNNVPLTILKSTGIVLFAIIEDGQAIATAYANHSNFSLVALTTLGYLPASLLSSIELFTQEIPSIKRFLGKSSAKFRRLNHELRKGWLYQLRHRDKTADRTLTIEERWKLLLEDAEKIELEDTLAPILARTSLRLLGVVASAVLIYSNFWELQKIMMKSLPEEVSARVLAAIFSVSFTYLLPKLVANPLVGIFDAIRCKANGLPIDWLPFQLAPKFMVAAIIIGAIATSLSFSSVLSLYLSAYHFIFKEALSYEVIAVIDLFYLISFVGGVSFACEQYYRFFGTKDEKSLLLFNDAVKAASKMNKKEIERMAPDIYDDYFLYAPSQPSKLELFKDWCKTKTCFFSQPKTPSEERKPLLWPQQQWLTDSSSLTMKN